MKGGATSRFDIAAFRDTLRAGAASPSWLSRWLADTSADPAAFLSELRAYGSLRRGGLKGGADGSVDFYHDCVVAHLGQAKRALIAREKGRDVELSYDSLHARCGGLLAAWRELGVLPGQRVCLLLKPGVDYAVALMTALRLGLTVCALPPGRPTFSRNRLEALAPDAVVAEGEGLATAQALGLSTLPCRAAREPAGERSQTYAADAAALCSFSPFGTGGLEPIELSAGALHSGLLRDALLVFALQGGDTIAMPGFDELVCQPTALLSTLLSGATWAELSPRDLREDEDALARQGVSLLGVTPALREQLLTLGSWPKGPIRAWFRALTDPLDMARWDRFTSLAVAAGVPGFNLVQAASAGGVILFGAPFKDGPGLHVWPPPGQPFQVSEVAADALPALAGSGVYYPLHDEELVEGAPRLYLNEAAHGYLCVGSLDVGPGAMSYPIDEVSLLAQAQPGVEYASVVVTAGSVVNTAQVTLLVFVDRVGPEAESSAVSPEKLSALIAREFGEAFAPTRVEVVPLRPRVTEGVLDRAWCRSQYLSGALRTKARREIFLQLSRLSYLLDVPESSGDGRDGGIA